MILTWHPWEDVLWGMVGKEEIVRNVAYSNKFQNDIWCVSPSMLTSVSVKFLHAI